MRFASRQSLKFLRSQKAGALIGSLLLIVGLGAFAHAAKITIDEKDAKNWVSHTAQIERAVVTPHVNEKGGKTYTVDVVYNYDWQGKTFEGNLYRLHDKPSQNVREAQEAVRGLARSEQEGMTYPIFVNPDNPRQSAVLNTAHPKARSGSLFLGFLFLSMGCFTVFQPKLFGKRAD